MENKVREVAQMRETKRQLDKQMIYHFIIGQNKKHVGKADIRDLRWSMFNILLATAVQKNKPWLKEEPKISSERDMGRRFEEAWMRGMENVRLIMHAISSKINCLFTVTATWLPIPSGHPKQKVILLENSKTMASSNTDSAPIVFFVILQNLMVQSTIVRSWWGQLFRRNHWPSQGNEK